MDAVEAALLKGFAQLQAASAGGRASLLAINNLLPVIEDEFSCSMTQMVTIIRRAAICLGNAKAYKNVAALRAALRKNRKLIVGLKQAKGFDLVKKCLVEL